MIIVKNRLNIIVMGLLKSDSTLIIYIVFILIIIIIE